ncbi:MAG: hypothetical protein AAGD35_17110 [Actinomycetota bacterium]
MTTGTPTRRRNGHRTTSSTPGGLTSSSRSSALITSLPTVRRARRRRVLTDIGAGTALGAVVLALLGIVPSAMPDLGGGPSAAEDPDPLFVPVIGDDDADDTLGPAFGEDVAAEDDPSTVAVGITAADTSRFVALPTTRVLDTRDGSAADPGETVEADVGPHVPGHATAVAVSVTVLGALDPGVVTASLDRGPVAVVDVGRPMTTAVAFVPRAEGDVLTLATAGGGHLVVDVIGYFVADGPTSAGRFVPVEVTTVAELLTAVDGREATYGVDDGAYGALPVEEVGSVVVRIRADVGDEGGVVRVGSEPDALANMMMWSATTGDGRTRQGTAVVDLNEIGQWSLSYEGGTALSVDLIGYFTNARAPVAADGLFVATDAAVVFDGRVEAGTPIVIDAAPSIDQPIGAVGVVITAVAADVGTVAAHRPDGRPGSGTVFVGGGIVRNEATIVPTDAEGRLTLASSVDADIRVERNGYFTGPGADLGG